MTKNLENFLGMPSDSEELAKHSKKQRIESYQNRSNVITWLGVGLAGGVALTGGTLYSNLMPHLPKYLTALQITLLIVDAVFFGVARVKFDRARRELDKAIKDWNKLRASHHYGWPTKAETYYTLGLTIGLLWILLLLSVTWLSVTM
ncbi:hypothetical protein [Streptomyces sp. CB02959]|uniref:hypothetical protein n=1 Tax=Streptomyces sp. CB02959 TaxID=2020330 RepID=UPI0011AF306F|nr:hypothetical protein [Streptomyces sp. CB02959]